MSIRRHIAVIRFGFGLRLGEAAPADPDAWLAAQLARPVPVPEGLGAREVIAVQVERRRAPDAAAARQPAAAMQSGAEEEGMGERPGARRMAQGGGRAAPDPMTALENAQLLAWSQRRLTTTEPLLDRLVDFWANHFNVSRRRATVVGLIPSMEMEAIRPHLMGRFADMLVAVTSHPAMLNYLDNATSIGPNSAIGQRTRRGLNENLAREVLELHTMSTGYTQQDVQELAKILTGWSVSRAEPYGFAWRPQMHEPGPKTLLGRRFAEGESSQEAALRMLAARPETYRFLALKLARHFVADTPPPSAVQALEDVLRQTEGDLGAVHRRLVTLPEAWEPPLTKFRPPKDFVLAVGRAVAFDRPMALVAGMDHLGQRPFMAPQPNGWPDRLEEWAAPEALMRRADWAYSFSGRLGRADLGAITEAALGPLARAETVSAMRGAGSVRDALTILFCSPEFNFR